MIIALKVRLEPNNKQKDKLFQSAGVARWAYNWTLGRQEDNYANGGKFIKDNDLRKELTQLKKTDNLKWLNDYSNNITKQAIKDACDAYCKFFKKLADKPKFKSRKTSAPKFYQDTEKIRFKDGKVRLENLAICSNIEKPFMNINKTKRVKKLEKKLKRLQRKVSNKYEQNKERRSYVKTKNIIKLEKDIKKLYKHLDNIRTDYRHKVTTEIVKTKPSRIVMESLNVRKMLKNKHLSRSIKQQGFHEFIKQIQYKSEKQGTEFIEANQWYPSSKTCSVCGHLKTKLSLSQREFVCECCGTVIDRDKNAAINLSRYTNSKEKLVS